MVNMDRESKEDNMFSREDQDRLSSTDLQQNGDNINNVFNGNLEEKNSLFSESLHSDQNAKVNYDIATLNRKIEKEKLARDSKVAVHPTVKRKSLIVPCTFFLLKKHLAGNEEFKKF